MVCFKKKSILALFLSALALSGGQLFANSAAFLALSAEAPSPTISAGTQALEALVERHKIDTVDDGQRKIPLIMGFLATHGNENDTTQQHPMYFGVIPDEERLYFIASPNSNPANNLEEDPNVSLAFVNTDASGTWHTAVIQGEAVPTTPALSAALIKHLPAARQHALEDLAGAENARANTADLYVYDIEPEAIFFQEYIRDQPVKKQVVKFTLKKKASKTSKV